MALLEDMIVFQQWKIRMLFQLVLVGFVFACQHTKEEDKLPFYNTAEFEAEWIKEADPAYTSIHTIDTFSLKNQLGNTITRDSLDGSIYVANFFFSTCPGICPKMTNNLQALQERYKSNRKLKLVSFSVMPKVDSVARLREYGKINNINPTQWYLLTGDKEQIYSLGRKSYFAEKGLGLQKSTSEFLHTETMLLIDKKARIRGIYNATQVVEVERISEDIEMLLKES